MKIYIIGIGLGNPNFLTKEAKKIIDFSDCLIGAERMLSAFEKLEKERFPCVRAEEIVQFLASHTNYSQVAILVSGDTGFYSIAKKLTELLGKEKVSWINGISSLQYFTGKLCVPWEDVKVISLHGRETNFINTVTFHKRIFFLTGGKYTVQEICQRLCGAGFGNLRAAAGENLSYPQERIVAGTVQQLSKDCFSDLAVLLVENDNPSGAKHQVHGLADEIFLRGQVPMTKSEIRSVCISKLGICEGDILYDIGAGTGSVSIEMALQTPNGQVYAVEKNPAAIELIQQNKEKFGVGNLQIVSGTAPDAIENLPAPDKVFIGGSSGNLPEILELLLKKNPFVKVTINAITLETLTEALTAFKNLGFSAPDVVQITVSRSRTAGHYTLMRGENPVYILTAQKGGAYAEI